ncbi:MAG TPA: hypothetical protein VFU88_13325 [Ktedonobacterales bacterium]|nr:hypothetical protein [Ktedonobacterales bacterium]
MNQEPNQQPSYGQPSYGQPSYTPPPPPPGQQSGGSGYTPPPPGYTPPAKPRSRRPLFIIGGIVAAVLVVCIAGVTAIALLVNNSPAKSVSQAYYQAMASQDYAKAYSYLDSQMTLTVGGNSQTLTQVIFTQAAQAYDAQRGKISSFSITGVSVSASTSSGSSGKVTVHVTRGSKSYDVHLDLTQEGNDWKISAFDSL